MDGLQSREHATKGYGVVMDVHEWVKYGVDKGFCTEIHCSTHDGVAMTDEEMDNWGEGKDDCIPVIRMWDNQ